MAELTGYSVVRVYDMLKQLDDPIGSGEDRVKSILSSFSCPLNRDVELFIRTKSIEFDKQGISRTYIVLTSYQKAPVIVGYFTIALKTVQIAKNILSSRNRKRIRKFATYNKDTDTYTIASLLIGQLGKNFTNGYDKLISGDELITLALEKVSDVHLLGGGKIVYLECEDQEKLLRFYRGHGFVPFGKRPLDGDEKGLMKSDYLIQLLKYCD